MNNVIRSAFVFLVIAACTNVEKDTFDSIGEDEIATGFKEGWLPPNMSKEAIDIKISRDVENGHVFGRYTYQSSEFATGLKAVSTTGQKFDGKVNSISSPEPPEWFLSDFTVNEIQFFSFGEYLFAVNPEESAVYFVR
jgi:hypothetical protein